MAEASKIEWCDSTFNPWIGCTKISPACDHCYAEAWAERFGDVKWGQPGEPGERRRTKTWNAPLKWERSAEQFLRDRARFRRVFCASLADVFDNQVPTEWRDDLWQLIRDTPNLNWLLLTKRPQNIKAMLPDDWGRLGYHNVWLGTTAEDQKRWDQNAIALCKVPARHHFVSIEPMLEYIDLSLDCGMALAPIDWVICGGESGGHARHMDPNWARSARDQCKAADVAFFMKQMTGKTEIPGDLLVRQFPDG